MDTLYTQAKNEKFMLRLPERMKDEIRRMAEMDGISINSAIVQRLAKSLREEKANGQQKQRSPAVR
ncbi:Arc family DNA-binding protein [Pectobacterium polonicum]|uniref:Arc family DNA-binding protein n=1 Tax=Pectobacterium polonicum TaxID=2485124 RepID=UPI003754EB17